VYQAEVAGEWHRPRLAARRLSKTTATGVRVHSIL
jgi:hypothetical protein